MMTTVLVVVVLTIAAVSGFLVLKRPESRTTTYKATGIEARAPAKPAAKTSPAGFVQVVPGKGDCCAEVRSLQTHRFAKAQAPTLPLENCTMPEQCGCQLQSVSERRSGRDRRSGHERREDIRFEPGIEPRRKNRGRRKEDNIWKDDS